VPLAFSLVPADSLINNSVGSIASTCLRLAGTDKSAMIDDGQAWNPLRWRGVVMVSVSEEVIAQALREEKVAHHLTLRTDTVGYKM
jgi:hypothetical protein